MPVRRLQSVHLLKPASNLIAYVFEAGYQSRFTVQSFVLIGNKRTPPPAPPPPYQTWRLFENAILTSTGFVYHFLTGWSFLMKRALHFATKLNSRDFHSKLFSSDLFVSSRKAVFPSPMASGVHRLRNTWSSLWEVICHKKKFNSPFWTNVWTP